MIVGGLNLLEVSSQMFGLDCSAHVQACNLKAWTISTCNIDEGLNFAAS